MADPSHLTQSGAVTPTLIAADRISGVRESAPMVPSRAVTAVAGRLSQLAVAVAVAPFAVLTVLFLGPDTV